jgi:uncharacterized protein YggE
MRRIAPLLLTLLLLAPASATAADPVPSTLSVVGEGTARLTPDIAVVVVDFQRRRKDAVAARNSVNKRSQRLIGSATALGIDRKEIQTATITLSRSVLHPLKKGGRQRIRYTAKSTVSVRVLDVDLTGKLLNAATAAGASGIDGPNFDFSDPTAGRAAAEKAAVENARRRADAAAALVGQKVIGVQSLDLNPNIAEPSAPAQQDVTSGTAPKQATPPPAPTPVSAGEEEFSATVTAVFLIAPL